MGRLFVAIELPEGIKAALEPLVPWGDGVRGVRPEAMHLTLRFLGEADPAPVALALGNVRAEPFPLEIRGVGRFGSRGRPTVLWAGVRESQGLMHLHAEVEEKLAVLGREPEKRPFHPHITLARAKPHARRDLLRAALETNRDLALPPFEVRRFVLFSSELRPT
ncbi:MAG: RNA 2',3'-cyclic phosphodiesterase, partial [Holophagales bacterium]|nr:RNA 2',3'-cyclic phosphodiesterase [Holophagales bacterium]